MTPIPLWPNNDRTTSSLLLNSHSRAYHRTLRVPLSTALKHNSQTPSNIRFTLDCCTCVFQCDILLAADTGSIRWGRDRPGTNRKSKFPQTRFVALKALGDTSCVTVPRYPYQWVLPLRNSQYVWALGSKYFIAIPPVYFFFAYMLSKLYILFISICY